MRKKKYMPYAIALLAFLVFLFLPFQKADVFLRIWLSGVGEELIPEKFVLYYATAASDFSPEQTIYGDYDEAHGRVTFRIDASLASQITLIRIDFPNENQVISIHNITVSSGGVIKKQYNPCYFFSEGNLVVKNGIYAVDLVPKFAHAYIGTNQDDPYMIFSDGLSRNIMECSSRFYLTKILIFSYLCACLWLYKKNFLQSETERSGQGNGD